MTIADAVEAVDYLVQTHTLQRWPDDVKDRWAEELADVERDTLRKAVRSLRDTDRISLAVVVAAVATVRLEAKANPRDEWSKCPRNCDHGWEWRTDDTVMPCSNCSPEQYQKWATGQYGSQRFGDPVGKPTRMPQEVAALRDSLNEL